MPSKCRYCTPHSQGKYPAHTWAAVRVPGADSAAARRSKVPGPGSLSTIPGGVAGAAIERSGGIGGGVQVDLVADWRARLPVGLPATLATGVRFGVVWGVCGMLTGAEASRPSCLQVRWRRSVDAGRKGLSGRTGTARFAVLDALPTSAHTMGQLGAQRGSGGRHGYLPGWLACGRCWWGCHRGLASLRGWDPH